LQAPLFIINVFLNYGRLVMASNLSSGKSDSGAAHAMLKAALAEGLERQLDKLLSSPLAPGLYLVSTPIGNLADISIRALSILASADAVFCEDTRHSRKLLAAYGIQRKLDAYHDFSGEKERARIMALLRSGKAVALISDAGTPLIADPGYKLVREGIAEGFAIFAVPGASALLAALTASGLPTDRFSFFGFLPPKETARRSELEAARSVPGTLVFYESVARLEQALDDLALAFPGREIAVARELTKLHETVLRGSAAQLLKEIRENPPLGEFVIMVGPGETQPPGDADIEAALRNALRSGSLKEAVEEVARGLGASRKKVYNLALRMRERE
jgi:16S rRNA (cytidine1402-2'-O)-methyltransferase